MKAVVVARPGAPDPLELVEVPDPRQPGALEIRVRLHGSSLNFHDRLVISDPDTLVGHVPLADGAGVVESVGPGVTAMVPGDAVFAAFSQWPVRQSPSPRLRTPNSIESGNLALTTCQLSPHG